MIKLGKKTQPAANTLSDETLYGKEPITIGGKEWWMTELRTSADALGPEITPTLQLTMRSPSQSKIDYTYLRPPFI